MADTNSQEQSKLSWLIRSTARALFTLFFTLGNLALVFMVLGFLGGLNPVLDLFSHFRWQYAAWLLFCAMLAILKKTKIPAALFLAGGMLNLFMVAFLWLPNSRVNSGVEGKTFTLLNMNLLYKNQQYTRILAEIEKYNPDVITMEELTPEGLFELGPKLNKYPYVLVATRTDPFGIGIFSKYPLKQEERNPLLMPVSFAARANVDFGEDVVSVCALHTLPPVAQSYMDADEELVQSLKRSNENLAQTAVIAGDFNATAWSHLFHELIESGNFVDSERGHGLQCSWPVGGMALMIPIDQVFVTPNLEVVSRELGSDIGSDHLPVFVKLKVIREEKK